MVLGRHKRGACAIVRAAATLTNENAPKTSDYYFGLHSKLQGGLLFTHRTAELLPLLALQNCTVEAPFVQCNWMQRYDPLSVDQPRLAMQTHSSSQCTVSTKRRAMKMPNTKTLTVTNTKTKTMRNTKTIKDMTPFLLRMASLQGKHTILYISAL